MKRINVRSSRLRSVGWEDNVLEVEFKDGAIYQYFDVSPIEFKNLMSAPSLGKELSRLEKLHRYSPV